MAAFAFGWTLFACALTTYMCCGIGNTAEEKRRASRLVKRTGAAAAASRKMPSIITGVQRLTQYSVKLVRRLRSYLWSRAPLDKLCLILTQLYKTL